MRWASGVVLLVLAYVSLVPFYYLQPLYLGVGLPPLTALRYVPAVAIGLLLVALFCLRLSVGRPLARTPVDGLAAVALATGLLSVFGAEYPTVSLAKWAYYSLTGVAIGWIVVQCGRDADTLSWFARLLGLLFGTVVLYTFTSLAAGQDYLWGDVHARNNPYYLGTGYRASAPFGNPVATGAYLLMAAPYLAWLSYCSPRRAGRLAYGALFVLCLYVLLMTQSRGAWLAGLAVLGVGAWVLVGRARLAARRQWAAAVVFLLAGAPACWSVARESGVTAWLEGQVARVADRAWQLSPSAFAHTYRFRIAQYRTAVNVLSRHPFLGVGQGCFSRVYDTYRDPSTPPVEEFPARTTENMYLMFAVETGMAGLASVLALWAGVGAVCWRRYHATPRGRQRGLAVASGAAGCGMLVDMVTWDALNDPTVRMLFWTVVGVLLAVESSRPGETAPMAVAA